MLGMGDDHGLIPRISKTLFSRLVDSETQRVEVSFMEIYNERVRDLLNISTKDGDASTAALRVRNHPKTGPYVEGLTRLAVQSHDEVMAVMQEGAKSRTVAATQMNETSSRSHAIFTLLVTQQQTAQRPALVSRIDLVDLAGSERACKTGAQGKRLREGASINQSLSTLGKVIFALADNASASSTKKSAASSSTNRRQTLTSTSAAASAATYIPYRDSTLTWLLKDSLGGNAKTIMLAAISPADIHFDETMSTLRYAERAKAIENKAVVNEDANAKTVKVLQEEVERLRNMMNAAETSKKAEEELKAKSEQVELLRKQLEQSESIMMQLQLSWEDKLRATKDLLARQTRSRQQMGLAVKVDNTLPSLVNLNEDRLMNEVLMYYLKTGETVVGSEPCETLDEDESSGGFIVLRGIGIAPRHCLFKNTTDGRVTIVPMSDAHPCFVNGRKISSATPLDNGDRLVLGAHHVFRFNDPKKRQSSSSNTQVADWNFALRELAIKQRLISEELEKSVTPVKKMQESSRLEHRVEEALLQVEKERDETKRAKERVIEQLRERERELEETTLLNDQEKASAKSMVKEELVRELSEYEAKEAELDELVEEHREKFVRVRERRFRERVSSAHQEESIMQAVLLVNEANTLSQEMGRSTRFELKLRPVVAPDNSTGSGADSEMVVEAVDMDTGRTKFLDVEQFAVRLRQVQDKMDISPASLKLAEDPFALDVMDETSLGWAYLYLKPLYHLTALSWSTPVVDHSGRKQAELLLEIAPSSETVNSLKGNYDSQQAYEQAVGNSYFEVNIKVKRISELEVSQYKSVRCEFSLWDAPKQQTKRLLEEEGTDFDFCTTLAFDRPGPDFAKLLRESFIAVEVLVGNLSRSELQAPSVCNIQSSVSFDVAIDVLQDAEGGFIPAESKRVGTSSSTFKIASGLPLVLRAAAANFSSESSSVVEWTCAELTLSGLLSRTQQKLNLGITPNGNSVVLRMDGAIPTMLSQIGADVQGALSVSLRVSNVADLVTFRFQASFRVVSETWKQQAPESNRSILRVHIKQGPQAPETVSNLIETHKDFAFTLDTVLKAQRIKQELELHHKLEDSTPLKPGADHRRQSMVQLTVLEKSLKKANERHSIAPTPTSAKVAQVDVSVKEVRSSAPDLQGWLKMSSSAAGRWKKLYFMHRRPSLLYWARKEDASNLGDATSIDLTDAMASSTTLSDRPNCFCITWNTGKVVFFQAPDNLTLQKWLRQLAPGKIPSTPAPSIRSPSVLRNLSNELAFEQEATHQENWVKQAATLQKNSDQASMLQSKLQGSMLMAEALLVCIGRTNDVYEKSLQAKDVAMHGLVKQLEMSKSSATSKDAELFQSALDMDLLKKELKRKNEELSRVSNQLVDAQGVHQSQDARIEQLEQLLQMKDIEVADLKQQNDDNVVKLQSELTAKDLLIQQLESKLAAAQEKMTDVTDDMESRLLSLTKQLHAKDQQVASLSKHVTQLQEKHSHDLEESSAKLARTKEDHTIELEKLQQEHQQTVESLQSKLNSTTQEAAEQKKAQEAIMMQLKAEIVEWKNKNAASVSELEVRVVDHERSLREQKLNHEQLVAEIRRESHILCESLNKDLELKSADVSALQVRLGDLQSAHSQTEKDLSSKIESLNATLSDKEQLVKTLYESLDTKEKELIEVRSKSAALLETHAQQSRNQLEALQSQLSQKDDCLDALRLDLTEQSRQSSVQLASLEKSLNERDLQLSSLQQDLLSHQEQARQLEESLAVATAGLTEAQSSMVKLQAEMDAYVSTISELTASRDQWLQTSAKHEQNFFEERALNDAKEITLHELYEKIQSHRQSEVMLREQIENLKAEMHKVQQEQILLMAQHKEEQLKIQNDLNQQVQEVARLQERLEIQDEALKRQSSVIDNLQTASRVAAEQAISKVNEVSKDEAKFSKDSFALLVKEKNTLKAAVDAHVSHSAFLTMELNTIRRSHTVSELETKSKLKKVEVQLAASQEEVARLERQLRMAHTANLVGSVESAALQSVMENHQRDLAALQSLKEELEALRKSYFLSFAISCKMNLSARGKFVNINVHDLYEECVSADVAWKDYPNWINNRIA